MGCMAQLQQGRIQNARPTSTSCSAHPPSPGSGSSWDAFDGERQVLDRERRPVKITAQPDAASRLKAFVTVMEGCEKHCTFCVVPVTRGRERSHAPRAIVEEIRGLAEAGCKEVTLLGQTVNAYGRDLDPPTDLPALLEQVNDVNGIERIRFTTSNPYNLTNRLIRAIRDVPKVVEYLHLPVQSGSDRILARTSRPYGGALSRAIDRSGARPDIALSTDIIVEGFPGDGRDFARRCPSSKRVAYDNALRVSLLRAGRGTPAADMPDQVPGHREGAIPADRCLEARADRSASGASPARRTQLHPRGHRVAKKTGRQERRTRCNRVVNSTPAGAWFSAWVVPVQITEALHASLVARWSRRGSSLGGMPCGSR